MSATQRSKSDRTHHRSHVSGDRILHSPMTPAWLAMRDYRLRRRLGLKRVAAWPAE